MPVENRSIRLMLCLAIGFLWLAGCGRRSTPQAAVTPKIAAEEIQPVQLTVEVPLTTSEPPTLAPTANSEGAPSPRQLTPKTAPPTAPPTTWPVSPVEEPYYEDRTGPANLLASYYNAINRQEYSRAWEYWETPPAPSFEEFAAGFADTASVLLAVRPPTRFEGAAGSRYASIPALLSATHVDGSRHNFVGCFVARCPNVGGAGIEQEWSLFNATVQRTSGNTSSVTVLEQVCATR